MALTKRGGIWHVSINHTDPASGLVVRIRRSTRTGDRKLAEVVHAEIQSALYRGTYVDPDRRSDGAVVTVGRCFDRWHDVTLARASETTRRSALTQWQGIRRTGLVNGPDPISTVTDDKLERLVAVFRTEGLSASTINHRLWALAGILDSAVTMGALKRSPTVPTYSDPRRDRDSGITDSIVQHEDEDRILAYLAGDPAMDDLRDLIVVLLDTGLRLSEALGLTRGDLKWHGSLEVVGKGSKRRTVPVTGRAREVLVRRFDTHDGEAWPVPAGFKLDYWVFRMNKLWSEVRADLGLQRIRLHDMRHTFGSRALAAGVPLKEVQMLMGHSSVTTTELYLHALDASPHAAASAIETFNATRRTQRTTHPG